MKLENRNGATLEIRGGVRVLVIGEDVVPLAEIQSIKRRPDGGVTVETRDGGCFETPIAHAALVRALL